MPKYDIDLRQNLIYVIVCDKINAFPVERDLPYPVQSGSGTVGNAMSPLIYCFFYYTGKYFYAWNSILCKGYKGYAFRLR